MDLLTQDLRRLILESRNKQTVINTKASGDKARSVKIGKVENKLILLTRGRGRGVCHAVLNASESISSGINL